MAHATKNADFVAFKAHSRTPAVAEATARELVGEKLLGYFEPSGQTLNNDAEGWTVTLSGREEAQHA